jgi:uncharacterized protein
LLKPFFLDTAYIYALFNKRDQWHQKAVEWQRRIEAEKIPLITTQFILIEIANGLSAVKFRQDAIKIIHILEESSLVEIVAATSELFALALALYEQRDDKDWGLTDCASFVVMTDNKITDALTTDIHFRQAGFNALLLN